MQTRWFHWLILLGIVLAGAELRFPRIAAQSLWLDEYWAVHLATGRGNIIVNAPHGMLIDPPPPAGFTDAPASWHIWTGVTSVVHPPFYYILLRGWIDLFGDRDFSVRALSATVSLAGIIAMFDVVRRHRGPIAALIAAGLSCFAPLQSDFSQDARPYTLIVLLSILAVGAMLNIEKLGATMQRLIWLGFTILMLILTHYLAIGGICGLGIYALIKFKGKDRRKIILTLFFTLAVFAIIWGPRMWAARQAVANARVDSPGATYKDIPAYFLIAPRRLLLGAFNIRSPIGTPWLMTLFLAAVVGLLPLTNRRERGDLLWWLWFVASLGVLVILDEFAGASRPPMISLDRYSMMASPAVYALAAIPIVRLFRARVLAAAAIVASISIVDKPFDWISQITPSFSVVLQSPWLEFILVLAVIIELVIVMKIRTIPSHSATIWIWSAGTIFLMMILGVFARRISYSSTINIALLIAFPLLLLTMPISPKVQWLSAAVLLICTAFAGISRFRIGPVDHIDWRSRAAAIEQAIPTTEPLIFVDRSGLDPNFQYMAFAHYAPDSHRPIVLISDSISSDSLNLLGLRGRSWLISEDASRDLSQWFPGWKLAAAPGFANAAGLTPIIPSTRSSE